MGSKVAVIHQYRVEEDVGRDMKPMIHQDVGTNVAVIHQEINVGIDDAAQLLTP